MVASAGDSSGTWVEKLLVGLRRQGLPLREILAVDGSLDAVLDGRGGPEIVVELRPLAEGARCYRSTRRFNISYRGVRDLGPAQRRAVDGLIDIIARIESRLPVTWPGVAAAGESEETEDLERAFTRRFRFAQLDRSHGDGGLTTEVLVRLTTSCNQDCPFCSGPPVDRPTAESVHACIDWVADHIPGARFTLTGGEPTLCSFFFDVIRHALARSEFSGVAVQTNAVRFASAARIAELPADERLSFFVSLHALDPEIYDRCTASRGQLPLAIDGLCRLLATRRPVTVNVVANAVNVGHLKEMMPALAELLAGLPPLTLHFSIVMCPPYRPTAADFLVRYTDLLPVLEAAAATAAQLGMVVDPLISSTHASIPLCLVGHEHRSASTHRPQLVAGETGYEDFARPWVKATSCRSCAFTERCLGVPTPYAQRFGFGELQPVSPNG